MIWLPCLTSWKLWMAKGAVLARYPGFEISAEEQAELVQFASRMRQALKIQLGPEQEGKS